MKTDSPRQVSQPDLMKTDLAPIPLHEDIDRALQILEEGDSLVKPEVEIITLLLLEDQICPHHGDQEIETVIDPGTGQDPRKGEDRDTL
jgi:hypothetical protein